MTIRYTNTFRDIMAFSFYHYPRTPLVIGLYGVAFVNARVAGSWAEGHQVASGQRSQSGLRA